MTLRDSRPLPGAPECIVQLGERLPSTLQPFAVLPEFAHQRR
jgi:hypothetical protein